MARMVVEDICKQCKQRGYFRTPELNEQLYLHFAGYNKIENLEPFTACRVLWLEHNSITTIENLEHLEHLRVVYLQHNSLRSLGACALPQVETLNVSHNYIDDLSGLANFPNLTRLYAMHNDIDDTQIEHLTAAPNLVALDLSKNKIENAEALVKVLAQLPQLASLVLSGNPVVREMKHYRKKMICLIPTLCHLDEMPVFDNERRTAEAWARGGREAEKAEVLKIRKEEEDRREEQRQFFQRFVADAKARGSTAGIETEYARTMRLAEEQREADARRKAQEEAAARTSAKCKSALTDDDDDYDADDIVVGGSPPQPLQRSAASPKSAAADEQAKPPQQAAAAAGHPALSSTSKVEHHADPLAGLSPPGALSTVGSVDDNLSHPSTDPHQGLTEQEVLERVREDLHVSEALARVVAMVTGEIPMDAQRVDEVVSSSAENSPQRAAGNEDEDDVDHQGDEEEEEEEAEGSDDEPAAVPGVRVAAAADVTGRVVEPAEDDDRDSDVQVHKVAAAEPASAAKDGSGSPTDDADDVCSSALVTPRPVDVV